MDEKNINLFKKVLKQRFVLDAMRTMRASDLNIELNEIGKATIEERLRELNFGQYVQLEGDSTLLGIMDKPNDEHLMSDEIKALQELLHTKLRKQLPIVVDLAETLYDATAQDEKSEIVTSENSNDQMLKLFQQKINATEQPAMCISAPAPTLSKAQNHMLELVGQRQTLLEKITHARQRHMLLLKQTFKMKTSQFPIIELELVLANMHLNEAKSQILHKYFLSEFLARSEHTQQALEKIDEDLNEALSNKEENVPKKKQYSWKQ